MIWYRNGPCLCVQYRQGPLSIAVGAALTVDALYHPRDFAPPRKDDVGMSPEIKAIIHEHLCVIIDAVCGAFVVLCSFGCSILLHWVFDHYLSGLDAFWFNTMLTVSDVGLVLPPAIKLYGTLTVLWIKVQGDIRKAKKEHLE